MTIIGLDPGFTGGICVIENDNVEVFSLPVMKTDKGKTRYDILKIVQLLSKYIDGKPIVGIEDVHTMPGQGLSSSGALLEGKGILVGITSALFGTLPKMISPVSWKKAFPQLTQTDDLCRRRDEIKALKEKLKSTPKCKSIKKEIAKLHGQFKSLVKTRTRTTASEMYPILAHEFKLVKDDGKADALFITLFAKQKYTPTSSKCGVYL